MPAVLLPVFGSLLLLLALVWASPAAAIDLEAIVLQNDPAPPPTAPGSVFRTVRLPSVGDAVGQAVAFRAKAKGDGGAERGIFIGDPDLPGSTVVLRNDETSDLRLFRTFSKPALNAGGTAVWRSRVTGSAWEGIFRSGLTDVARRGDAVPTLTTGTLDDFSLPLITDDGDVVFHATIDDGDVVSGVEVEEGIFRCTGGDGDCHGGTGVLTPLALVADPVPDRPGYQFCNFEEGVSASTWGVAFRGRISVDCSDGGEPVLQGVFRRELGHPIETLAVEGEGANTTSGAVGSVYYLFREAPAIEDDGVVVFHALTTGTGNEDALLTCDPAGALPCPANPAEARFATGSTDAEGDVTRRIASPVIGDDGTVVFLGAARGESAHGRAIYTLDAGSMVPDKIAVKKGLLGDPAYPTATFGRVEVPSVSPGGRIVFAAKIKSPSARAIILGQ